MDLLKLVTINNPKSPASEVYRTLRTNIKFASFEKIVKSIAITSSRPHEGKSTITTNLAVTMAQTGKKVLIVEGDLRNPQICELFMLPNKTGLTDILTENKPYTEFLNDTGIENLKILASGPIPPNPAELLGSQNMKDLIKELKQDFEYILIDTPPCIAVTDAALLSSICDGTILVVASGETEINSSIKTKQLLENVGADILGVVLNKIEKDYSKEYYSYYHYYSNNKIAKA